MNDLQIYKNVTDKDYRLMPGHSQSKLASILKSPRHFNMFESLIKESDEMRFGTAFHMAFLEPGKFKDLYAIAPECYPDGETFNKRTNKYKDFMVDFESKNMGRLVIDADEAESLAGMLTSLANEPSIVELFHGADKEVVGTWTRRGYECKGRLDAFNELKGVRTVLELKSAKDASPQGFTRAVWNNGYDFQANYYADGFKAKRHIVVAVEKKFPFAVGVYDMHHWLEYGHNRVEKAFDRLDALGAGLEPHWYTAGVEHLLPPSWAPNLAEE